MGRSRRSPVARNQRSYPCFKDTEALGDQLEKAEDLFVVTMSIRKQIARRVNIASDAAQPPCSWLQSPSVAAIDPR